jgi:GGDEF domain-containing protein
MTQDDSFLQDQISRHKESKRRLDDAQRPALSDPTTGLFNRHVGESYLRLRLADNSPVTVFLLECDESSLQSVSRTLVALNGTFEMVCRWNAHQFALIASGEARRDEMEAQVRRGLRDASIPEMRIAIATSRPGDSIADILSKLQPADQELRL